MKSELTGVPAGSYRHVMTTSMIPQVAAAAARPPLLTKPLAVRFVTVFVARPTSSCCCRCSALATAIGAGGYVAGLIDESRHAGHRIGEAVPRRLVADTAPGVLAGGLASRRAGARPDSPRGAPGRAWWASAWYAGSDSAYGVVAGAALTAPLIPEDRRGEGLALLGIVSGVPSLVALPRGVARRTSSGTPRRRRWRPRSACCRWRRSAGCRADARHAVPPPPGGCRAPATPGGWRAPRCGCR